MGAAPAYATCAWCGRPTGTTGPSRPWLHCSAACRGRAHRPHRTHGGTDQLGTFASAVRTAIADRGLSLREISVRLQAYGSLATSTASLSQWQSGRTVPPATSTGRNRVLALERTLDLPAGSLALLLPTVAAAAERELSYAVGGVTGAITPQLDALRGTVDQLSGTQNTIPVSIAHRFLVGGRRRPVRTEVTRTVRAAQDAVDCHWLFFSHGPHDHASVIAGPGCRIGRHVTTDQMAGPWTTDSRVAAVELLFDRILRRGEGYTFRYMISHLDNSPPSYSVEQVRHIHTEPVETIRSTLQFEANVKDLSIAECHWRERGLVEELRREVRPDSRFELALSLRNPIPGGYGWRWQAVRRTAATPTAVP